MRFLTKLAILAAGWLLVAAGVVLIPLPGPGIPVVMAGIYVLSLRSARARLLVSRLKARFRAYYPDAWKKMAELRTALRRRLAADRTK
ncbi:MAG: PGPGW domain-containing protein [Elusimicrobiales bacterium]